MTDLRRHIPPVALTWDAQAPQSPWRRVDGTLVFADVSGFTALTERLSRRGRIGAEEIVETLNSVFGPMLEIAAARGGELLKFGGDALLFLFRGEAHPEQACDAAVEMRAALRHAAAVPTAVGRLRLSMSVGVHSGGIDLFLVGSPTRELFVLGPAATTTAAAEKAAEAGQIVVSASTAERLSPGSVRSRADGELVLRRRLPRTRAPGCSPMPEASAGHLATLFPHALGSYLAPAIPDPEHRLACIAFVRFSGTDALLASAGPAVLADALHRTMSLVQTTLAAEDVTLLATDLDSDGGKLFLGSGIPVSHEDAEGRMLRALRALADSDPPLPLALGVNRGHVFAAEVGGPERAAYSGMGDTTNTAARIMAAAPPGQLYAHPAVLAHSRTRFAVEPAGPFAMKGLSQPMLLHAVGAELGTQEEAVAETELPFLGRDSELAVLRAALADGAGGHGQVVCVTGGTGVGKTRLVREALAEVAAPILVLRAEPYGAAAPYRVFRDPIRRLLGLERGEPAAMGRALLDALALQAPDLLQMAPLLADVVQVPVPSTAQAEAIDPQYRAEHLAGTMIRLLDQVRPGPLVIAAEEAHWADAASAHLLDRIAATTPDRAWTLLAIRREEGEGFMPTAGQRIALEPLPPSQIERLVIAATEATPLRPHELAAIVSRAEGSPLYVDEVARVARGSGSLDELPESVGAALSIQIDQLTPRARRVLRYCAVLGRSFRIEILRRTLAGDSLDLAAADLTALSTFIEPDGPDRVRFRNSLVRDAAYAGIAFRTRARLHRTAGETLERISTDLDADAPMLALHFWRAGDAEQTWRYAQRAGAIARTSGANVDAAEQYERALEVARRVPTSTVADTAALLTVLGELRELAGILDGAVEAFRRAERLIADPVARAAVMARRARVHSRAGRPATTVRVVGRARQLLLDRAGTQGAQEVSARLDYLMAVARLGQDHPASARSWAARAVSSARAIDDSATLIRALMAVDFAEQLLGHSGIGAATREALVIAVASEDRLQESVARANLGVLAFYAGHWDEAVGLLRTSSQVAIAAGNDFGAAETDLTYADILIHQGRLDEAEDVLARALRVLRASGIDEYAAHARMLQARTLLARGEATAAAQLAAESVAQSESLGSAIDAYEASLVQAEAMIGAGQSRAALELAERKRAAAHGEGVTLESRYQVVRVRAFLAESDAAFSEADRAWLLSAREAVELGLAAAVEQDLPYEQAVLHRLRAQVRRLSAGMDADADADADEATARRLLDALGAVG